VPDQKKELFDKDSTQVGIGLGLIVGSVTFAVALALWMSVKTEHEERVEAVLQEIAAVKTSLSDDLYRKQADRLHFYRQMTKDEYVGRAISAMVIASLMGTGAGFLDSAQEANRARWAE